jgi:hypothetical protein
MWEKSAAEFQPSPRATPTVVNNEWLRINGNDENYGIQLTSEPINVERFHDYVLTLPFKLEEGRVVVKISNAEQTKTLAFNNVDLVEEVPAYEQPVNQLTIPFVSANNSHLRILIANNASARPVMLVGRAKILDLGASSLSWLRYVRMPLRIPQLFFKTAWVLPLVVIGIVLLIHRRQLKELAILLVVPAYYLIVQSVLHTERRYIYVIHYSFLVLVSVSLWWVISVMMARIERLRRREVSTTVAMSGLL